MFGNSDITITTDASNLGWGAVCNGTKTGGPWGNDEADFHINYLEMKAVLLGLKSLCNNTTGTHVRVQSDNTTTVSYSKRGQHKAFHKLYETPQVYLT